MHATFINNDAAKFALGLALRDASKFIADAMNEYMKPNRILAFHLNDDYIDYLPMNSMIVERLSNEAESILFRNDDDECLAIIESMNADNDFIEYAMIDGVLAHFLRSDDEDVQDDWEIAFQNRVEADFNAHFINDDELPINLAEIIDAEMSRNHAIFMIDEMMNRPLAYQQERDAFMNSYIAKRDALIPAPEFN